MTPILVAVKDHPGVDTVALAAALQVQGAAVSAAWSLGVDVRVVRYKSHKPKGAWRIQFYDELPAGEGGIHLNGLGGTPYAKILASEGTLAASHEFCEMLVDPQGQRFQSVGPRRYLVEVCDPVERRSYEIDGVEVSDFILPGWYGTGQADALAECRPLEILPGGYDSYIEAGDWWQNYADDQTGHVTARDLGRAMLRTRAEKDRLAA